MTVFAKKIKITGLVQGVGFRPFIYKHALKYSLSGWVENRNDGVVCVIEGDFQSLKSFIDTLEDSSPLASSISTVNVEDVELSDFNSFSIKKSESVSEDVTEVSPDIAVCDDCLEDIKTQKNRVNYAFTNCTNCGPRFTIIKDLPYDRQKTTMQPFVMCENCQKEYTDIMDRRFHAQPVACDICGPQYQLQIGDERFDNITEIIDRTCQLIEEGKIVSIKGLGGYFMACDANNEAAVQKMRDVKGREMKPFAVMFPDIEIVKKYAFVNDGEEKSLTSWRRPIVLLNHKKQLAPGVSYDFDRTGVMLPYMPLHHMLFENLQTDAIVLTSGNISDEPIVISNDEAEKVLLPISDALITYNRDIYNRADDSVQMHVNGKDRLIRRSRGYVPNPINLELNVEGIFAAGAELVNCFCIGKKNQTILSQHIGDIKNYKTYEFYTESIERFQRLFRLNIDTVVYDLHQDYFSTKFALDTGKKGIGVQHHHAHIASCMAEHGLDETVIGIAFDGTGLGTDGKIWGGEFFIADLNIFERYSHFDYIPMPGGDLVTKEPWRTGVSYLYSIYGREFLDLNLPFLQDIPKDKLNLILMAIDKKLNCPESSSAGRLFDAVAAISGICPVSNFHAEAPMRLEAAIEKATEDSYEFTSGKTISFENTIKQIVDDVRNGVEKSIIAVKFHNTIINCIFTIARKIREERNVDIVVMSGGSFQNAYILEKAEQLLEKNGFTVYAHEKVPTNDAGIALGQLAIAAKRRERERIK